MSEPDSKSMTYPYGDEHAPKRKRWFVRVLRRIHDRLDAIFIFGYLAGMGALAYWMHINLF